MEHSRKDGHPNKDLNLEKIAENLFENKDLLRKSLDNLKKCGNELVFQKLFNIEVKYAKQFDSMINGMVCIIKLYTCWFEFMAGYKCFE